METTRKRYRSVFAEAGCFLFLTKKGETMGLLLAVVAITITAQIGSSWAEEYTNLRLIEQKNVLGFSEGVSAFWHSQLGEIGRYHLVGMPKEAVLIARLHNISNNNSLVLCDENHKIIGRIPFKDVDQYYCGLPPAEDIDLN